MKNKQNLFRSLIMLALFVTAISIVAMFLHNCDNYYDFGIYSDALIRINWHDWNPYIPGRHLTIFSDHFDPILIPFSFLTRVLPAPYLGILIEFLSMALCWVPLEYLVRKGRLLPLQATLLYGILILNPAISSALHFPFHPTTWATFPMLMFLAALDAESLWTAFVFFLILCTCKEEFPFLGLTTAAYLWLVRGKKKESICFATAAILILYFDYILRPKLLGPTMPYARILLNAFFADPMESIGIFLKHEGMRFWVRLLIPLFLILPMKLLIKNAGKMAWALWVVGPIFGIRFLSGLWTGQYGPVAAVGALWIYLQINDQKLASRARIYICAFVVTILFGFTEYQELLKAFSTAPETVSKNCPATSERLKTLETLQHELADRPEKSILLGHNLVVKQLLYSPEKELHDTSIMDDYPEREFELFLTEKIPADMSDQKKYARLLHLLETLRRSPDVKVIWDDEHFFFASGRIRLDL